MTGRTLLLTTTLLAAPVVATAQPVSGLYVGAGAGYNYLQNQDVQPSFSNGATTLNTEPGSHLSGSGGPVALASIGFGFGNGFRLEVQGDWRAQHDKYDHGAGGNFAGGADLQTYGGFVNALYDFNLGLPVFPYLGVGVGYEETFGRNFTLYRHRLFSGVLQEFDFSNNSQGSIAAQGIVGAAFPFPGLPGLSVTAEYRFMYVADSESFDGSFANGAASFPARIKIGSQYNHAALIGLRYAFNVPAPPPPRPLRWPRRLRPLRAPTWCSSTGIAPTSPPAPARSSARRLPTRRMSRSRASWSTATPTCRARRPTTRSSACAAPTRWLPNWCATASPARRS